MPTVAIIPVKSFHLGNQRLAGVLTERQRINLGRALARHVARTAEDAGLMSLFVSDAADVAEWAAKLGFPTTPDPSQGLDGAARAGVEWAAASGSRWMVIHSDLPLLSVKDLVCVSGAKGDVIAPSADGGTTLIGSSSTVEFSFGPGSFHRHLGRLHEPEVIVRTGLLHDVDSPRDLKSVLAHSRGEWLREVV